VFSLTSFFIVTRVLHEVNKEETRGTLSTYTAAARSFPPFRNDSSMIYDVSVLRRYSVEFCTSLELDLTCDEAKHFLRQPTAILMYVVCILYDSMYGTRCMIPGTPG